MTAITDEEAIRLLRRRAIEGALGHCYADRRERSILPRALVNSHGRAGSTSAR